MDIVGFLRDPESWRDMRSNARQLAQSASNAIAGNVTGPVDLINLGLGAIGLPVSERPVGGSEWARRAGLTPDVPQGAPRVAGETLGLLGPVVAAKYAPQIAEGLLAAGDAMPSASVGGKVAPNQKGIFAGTNAQNANLKALDAAKGRIARGDDPAVVWAETGWGKGPDGKWRFEISDDIALYRPGAGAANALEKPVVNEYEDAALLRRLFDSKKGNTPKALKEFEKQTGRQASEFVQMKALNASDVSQLDSLAKRIAKDAPTRDNWTGQVRDVLAHKQLDEAYPWAGGTQFSVKPIQQYGYLGSYADDGVKLDPSAAYGMETGKSITLHELQHAIQPKERFALGGNSSQARQALNAAGQLRNVPPGAPIEELALRYQRLESLPDYALYERLAGEAEARLTQARMAMSPAERAAQYPWSPAYFQQATGVPMNDLIFYNGLLD